MRLPFVWQQQRKRMKHCNKWCLRVRVGVRWIDAKMYDMSFCCVQQFHVKLTVTWNVDRHFRLIVLMCCRSRMRNYRVVAFYPIYLHEASTCCWRAACVYIIEPTNSAAMPQERETWTPKHFQQLITVITQISVKSLLVHNHHCIDRVIPPSSKTL